MAPTRPKLTQQSPTWPQIGSKIDQLSLNLAQFGSILAVPISTNMFNNSASSGHHSSAFHKVFEGAPVTRPVGVLDPAPPKGSAVLNQKPNPSGMLTIVKLQAIRGVSPAPSGHHPDPKFVATWTNLALCWSKLAVLSVMFVHLVHLGSYLASTWSIFAPTWSNCPPTWPNLVPSWRNLVPTWSNFGPNLVQLGPKI